MPSLHAIFPFCIISALHCGAGQIAAHRTGKAIARNRYGLAQQKRFGRGYSQLSWTMGQPGLFGYSRTLAATSANANTIVATVSGRTLPLPTRYSVSAAAALAVTVAAASTATATAGTA